MVLSPDPPNTLESMEPLYQALAPHLDVIAYEGPGFGYSSAHTSMAYTLDDGARVLAAVLDGLGVQRAVIAHTCVAAFAALRFARVHPERTTGLALGQVPCLSASKAWARRVDFRGALATPFVGQVALRIMRQRVAQLWYANALPRGADPTELTAMALDSFKRGARFPLASALQALHRAPEEADLLQVGCPTVVLWGDLDRTHRHTDKASITEHATNAEIRHLPNCGHFPDLERPDAFSAAVLELARVG